MSTLKNMDSRRRVGRAKMFGKGLDRDLNVKGGCGIKPEVSLLWKTDWHFRTDQLILLLPVHALFIIIDCFLAPQVTSRMQTSSSTSKFRRKAMKCGVEERLISI